MTFLKDIYNLDELNNAFRDVAGEAVTSIANSVQPIKTLYEEGGPMDTDENAERIMLAVVDELAERIKSEVRFRISLYKHEKQAQKERLV